MGQYCRRTFCSATTEAASSTETPTLGALVANANVSKAPRKRAPLTQYMKMFYGDLMKDEGDRRVKHAEDVYEALPLAAKTKKNKPVPLEIRKTVAREFWETETEEVKAAVLAKADEYLDEDMEEWSKAKNAPKTPAQYHQ